MIIFISDNTEKQIKINKSWWSKTWQSYCQVCRTVRYASIPLLCTLKFYPSPTSCPSNLLNGLCFISQWHPELCFLWYTYCMCRFPRPPLQALPSWLIHSFLLLCSFISHKWETDEQTGLQWVDKVEVQNSLISFVGLYWTFIVGIREAGPKWGR